MKAKTPARKILSGILILIVIVLVAAAALIATLTALEYRPEDTEPLALEGTAEQELSVGDTFTIMTWNTGYGALGDNADFFMDGGSMVKTADLSRLYDNLYGILGEIRAASPDILFLQEVDRHSSRSEYIDESDWYRKELEGYQSSFANNYKAVFVPYPLPPLGQVDSGVMTFSRYPASSAERIQLPIPFSWPIRTVNLKRCLDVERVPVKNSEHELVLVNLHLEAYDSGEGKIAQTNMLIDLLREEAVKGNYVIAGGDFNQIFPNIDSSAYPVLEDRWQPGEIDIRALEEIWTCIMDTSVPSCRSLDQPYAGADKDSFQYYLIDGFIVSDTLAVQEYHTEDLGFACSDHNPLVMQVQIPDPNTLSPDTETGAAADTAAEAEMETGSPADADTDTNADSRTAGGQSTAPGANTASTEAASETEASGIPEDGSENASQDDNPEYTYDFSLGFAGDICLADNYIPMQYLQAIGSEDIADGIDPRYITLMNDMDLMWINNEFAYSTRGEPLYQKAFTFCANPANVSYLHDLGIDIVGLANNHAYDYGEDAFLDTLDTLQEADIPYVGAGRNIEEAAAPVYLETNGFTIAYVAASRAEYSIFTPEATETEPGILCCYDFTRFLDSIREAAEHADYVIALPHWGTEHSTFLEDAQRDGARACLDAGADTVIGAHPHILQGIEYSDGKPILYSLGNFWFDNYDIDTMVAELHFTGTTMKDDPSLDDAQIELIVHPGTQTGTYTWWAYTDDWEYRILRYLEQISQGNITIDEQHVVHENLTSEPA